MHAANIAIFILFNLRVSGLLTVIPHLTGDLSECHQQKYHNLYKKFDCRNPLYPLSKMSQAVEVISSHFGSDHLRPTPSECYHLLKKIDRKEYSIAGTRVNREVRRIKNHQKAMRNIVITDAANTADRAVLAARSHRVAIDKVNLLDRVTLKTVNALEKTVLEKSECLEKLVRGRQKSNSGVKVDITRLFRLVKEGNYHMVKRVLMAAPDGSNFLNICHEPLGNTMLHIAAGKGDVAMCKLLLNFGTDPNIRNYFGKVPLHVAWSSFLESPTFEKQVKRVQAETCIEFLLQYGADPNIAVLHTGDTPLHAAARIGNAKVATRLLSFGGNPLAANNDGATPLDDAADYGHYEACRVMGNWPSVLKELRLNEVREKWCTFLKNCESSIAQTPTSSAILMELQSAVQSQKANLKQTRGKIVFFSFSKDPTATTSVSKRISKSPLSSKLKQRQARAKKYRPSKEGREKKMALYENQVRFKVQKTVNFNQPDYTSPIKTRRLESALAMSTPPVIGHYPALASPLRKSSKPKPVSDKMPLTPSQKESKVGNNALDNGKFKQDVSYNDPRGLPPQKTANTPVVLPKPGSIAFKCLSERQKTLGVSRVDFRGQRQNTGQNQDSWKSSVTMEDRATRDQRASILQI